MKTASPGSLIGEYELIDRLGEGGFAEVWRARHHILQQTVALKLPRDEAAAARFREEITTLDALNHPGIVPILAASVSHDPPYLVMELLPGGTLRDRIGRGPIPLDEVEALSRALLEALAAAHEAGIVHGDLKPENILFDAEGRPRIADFGLARSADEARAALELSASIARSGSISGTLDYMPREVRDGAAPDARADIFAFGVLLFELLAGRRPDVDERPSDLNPDAAAFDELFRGCYRRYEERFSDARAALQALPPLSPAGALESPAPAPEAGGSSAAVWSVTLILGFVALPFAFRFLGGRGAALFGLIYFGALSVLLFLPDETPAPAEGTKGARS